MEGESLVESSLLRFVPAAALVLAAVAFFCAAFLAIGSVSEDEERSLDVDREVDPPDFEARAAAGLSWAAAFTAGEAFLAAGAASEPFLVAAEAGRAAAGFCACTETGACAI